MHRSIGKRIRMDEPPPPEYDTTNPMSPEEDNDVQEPYSLYESYSTQRNLPTDSGLDSYTHERTQSVEDLASQQYETHSQYNTIPQGNQVSNYDTNSQSEYVPPLPPYEGRITRSYLKNAGNPQAQAAWRRPLPEEKPRRGRPRKNPEPMGVDACLYGIIKRGQVTLPTTVDEWIESYKLDRESALLELMQFFISAAGCKGKITQDMADNMEHAAIIRKMTEEFDEESGEYPLIMSGLQWKKFRSNFCDFISHLVSQCQYAIIYDQYLMDNVISLLTGLSDSQVRAFRHTATLAAMKLMSALVDVAIDVSVNLENTKRQYESERQKARDKRASDRLEHLISKRQELEENTDEIKNMLTYLFKAVFVHRYRDTLPEIRAICITELGIWMKKFHQFFLDDSYLKYIGWTLHDKVGEVRLKCLQSLQPLYSEELKGKLELFTSKFKDRIVEMTLDKEYEVAVEAIRLVISILKNHRDILTDRDCEHVYELVYSSNRSIAQAAGEFLNERLFVVEDVYVQRTRRGKIRLPNTPLIRDLVQFFIESELHEHGAYLVDSLIESNAMMKDWECMTDLLLEEPGPEEEPLDDRQETSLIELMVCCIKQTSLGEPPIGRGLTRKIPSVKEIKQVQDDKQKLTEHFIGVLPSLLDKYSADPEKLTNLLNIPQHFNLEIYTTSRQEANLDLTLKKIHHITEKHHDTEVLETCAKTLEMLCSEDFPIYMRCDVQRSTLIDAIVNKYKEIMDDWNSLIESEEIPDEDENYNVINSLKKVSIFYSCHNLGTWNIWSSLMKDVEEARMGNSCLPEEAIKYCISSCFYALLWDLHHIEELVEGGARVDDTIAECRGRLISLMEGMKQILLGQHSQVHKEESYLAICDLLVVFSNQLYSNSQAALSGLVYEPDNDLISILNNFVQINVFNYEEIDEQSKIAELHKRRNFLASYCKLIVYSIVPTTCASDVFKHYLKSYNDYGDIIKTTIGKARDINKVNCARTMATALTSCFRELMMKPFDRRLYRAQDDFANLKELAKRFALTFGLDPIKNREGVTALHRDGILFAVADHKGDPTGPPPNLPFLEVLTEFTNRLLRQDRRVVLNYLDRRITIGMPSSRGEDWQALVLYRNSLIHGEADHPPVTAKRAYTRRRNFVDYGVGDEGTSDSDFMPGF